VQVEVQESLWNRTEGLCGNINGDASDDLLNKDGYKPQTIANLATSWKVENLEKECNHLPLEEHACLDDEIDGSKNHEAMVFCKKLLNDQRFAPCHQVIDVSLLLTKKLAVSINFVPKIVLGTLNANGNFTYSQADEK
jgi:von Willebrand factor